MTRFTRLLSEGARDEDGAVTVDWVVLTAAIVGLAFAALGPIGFSTNNAAQATAEYIGSAKVGFDE